MSRKISITILVDCPVIGGAELHAVFLTNSLSRALFEVSFYQIKAGGASADLVCKETVRTHGVGSVLRGVTRDGINELARFLDETGAEVILAANPYATLYAKLSSLRSARRPRVVSTLHTMGYLSGKNRAQMWFYRLLYPLCDCLVYVCEAQRRFWRQRGLWARRDRVIYNGVDVRWFDQSRSDVSPTAVREHFGIPRDEKVVGVCAALRAEKAHIDLLGALQELKRRGRNVYALIVGDGSERERILQAAGELDVRDAVKMAGAQQDVRPYILACDAMVLPSHTETFSLSVLESLALGKPMVLTAVGGASEQVRHGVTGLLYPAGDISGLAASIERLLFDMDTARAGAAAASFVRKEFDASRMVQQYEELLMATLGRSG